MKKKARVIIDGRSLEVDGNTTRRQAAPGAGLTLPYFCWHPALGSSARAASAR